MLKLQVMKNVDILCEMLNFTIFNFFHIIFPIIFLPPFFFPSFFVQTIVLSSEEYLLHH